MDAFEDIRKEVERTQVIIPAGGKAKRMGAIDKPKALLELGNKTLLDLCIELCESNGFKEFVFLLGYRHKEIEEHLKKKNYFEKVRVRVSIEPETVSGKGMALRYALENNKIEREKRALMLFPDDIILDRKFPLRFLLQHLHNIESNGVIATVALVSGSQYPYGVAEVDATGIITNFQEKPFIERYTNTGLVFMEPEVFKYIERLIPLESEKAIEFEEIVLPALAKEKKVAAMITQPGIWIPVNTYKEYEKAEGILKEKGII